MSLEFIHKFGTAQPRKRDGLWWVSFVPKGLGLGVPYDSELDRERYGNRRYEIASLIYEELKRIQVFEIALLGWEISDQWFDPTEEEHVLFGEIRLPTSFEQRPGLIISEKIWQSIDHKSKFQEFVQGMYWIHHQDWKWDNWP